jgi:hypothetical protein
VTPTRTLTITLPVSTPEPTDDPRVRRVIDVVRYFGGSVKVEREEKDGH